MPPKPPRLSGPALVAARIAAENPATAAAVREVFKRSLRIDALGDLPDEWRTELPLDQKPVRAREPRSREDLGLPAPRADRDWPRPAAAYVRAYAAGETSPTKIVARALDELRRLADRSPCMNVLTGQQADVAMREAAEAEARRRGGRSRGPLDGVPIVVKDEVDVVGLSTRLGSICEPDAPASEDATAVARLREAGAIIVGKTVLTEYGMSPLGTNPHVRMPHNAHDPTRAAGGSSTGTAVAVALGAVPLGLGSDGGGSIRIPSALNGIFGIKPTFGRVSRAGDGFKGSVAHVGPLGTSVADLVAFLDAVASEADPRDALTSWAPPPPAGGFGARVAWGVKGLRIGIDEDEWAAADEPVARACREALAALEKEGAKLVPVHMPVTRWAAPIGYLTIGPEALASVRRHWTTRRDRLGEDVRLSFAVLSGMTAAEQLDAQRLRGGLRQELAKTLREVDVIALPTTAITAPRYGAHEERAPFSDPAALDGLCRYAFLGNLTGLPAATAPVGRDAHGLPIGLQILGDAWDEATVLGVLAHLERTEVARVARPASAIDLLG